MNGYEKIIKTVRKEAGRNQVKYPVKVATMTSPTSCKYGNMELDKDDLFFAEHLIQPQIDKRHFKMRLLSGGNWNEYEKVDLDDDSAEWLDKSKLKKGDKVLIVRISEDKFAVVERLVSV